MQKDNNIQALTSTIDANTNEQIYRKSYERGSGSPLVVRLSCFFIMANFNNELNNYQVIPRDLIFDNTLSDRARFVFCFMASKPNGWDFFLEPMAKEIGYSVETLRKYINELVNSGWLEKGKQKKEKGVFGATEYTLKATKSPCTENTESQKFRVGKIPTLYNIDNKEKQDNKENKENFNFDEIRAKWEEVNPTLPSIRAFSEKRKKALRTLLKNNNATIDDLYKVFEIISVCSFCQGNNDRKWTATLDWVLSDTKGCFNRLLEGVYAFSESEKQRVQQIVDGQPIAQSKNETLIINGVCYK